MQFHCHETWRKAKAEGSAATNWRGWWVILTASVVMFIAVTGGGWAANRAPAFLQPVVWSSSRKRKGSLSGKLPCDLPVVVDTTKYQYQQLTKHCSPNGSFYKLGISYGLQMMLQIHKWALAEKIPSTMFEIKLFNFKIKTCTNMGIFIFTSPILMPFYVFFFPNCSCYFQYYIE